MIGLPERCSDAEFERRHSVLRAAMRADGMDCLLVYGTSQGWQNVFYLSNHWDLVSCWLILPAESEPVLLTGVYPHLAAVRRVSIIPDIRFGGTRSTALIAEIVAERGLDCGAVGIVEADEYRMPGIPYREMLALQKALPETALKPATAMVEAVRRCKSAEEIDILRGCAELSDRALERAVEAIRPGVTERDVAEVIAGSAGETVAVLVGSTSMDRPDTPAPAIRYTSRELRRGDVIMIELSKGVAGYAGQVHGTITLGPPTDRIEELHQLAAEAYVAIFNVLRAGCTPQEAADAARIISDAGYTVANPLIHGFGMGIESGLHVGMPGHEAYWPPANFTFPTGASVTIEPNPCTPDMSVGGTAGGLVIVHEDGCEELQRLARAGLIIA